MATLEGKKIALLATDGFEDDELTKPLEAIREAGAHVTIISNQDSFTGKNGTEMTADMHINDASADDFDGLLLPGGVENPDHMRQEKAAITFINKIFEQAKPVAAICHAPWLLVEADDLQGRTLTSWPSLKTDIINAGGLWLDEEVVVDYNLVTSRNPGDIPVFIKNAIEKFAEGPAY